MWWNRFDPLFAGDIQPERVYGRHWPQIDRGERVVDARQVCDYALVAAWAGCRLEAARQECPKRNDHDAPRSWMTNGGFRDLAERSSTATIEAHSRPAAPMHFNDRFRCDRTLKREARNDLGRPTDDDRLNISAGQVGRVSCPRQHFMWSNYHTLIIGL